MTARIHQQFTLFCLSAFSAVQLRLLHRANSFRSAGITSWANIVMFFFVKSAGSVPSWNRPSKLPTPSVLHVFEQLVAHRGRAADDGVGAVFDLLARCRRCSGTLPSALLMPAIERTLV